MNPSRDFRRHRVDIQKPVTTQDSETGEITVTWITVYPDVPCSINPLSVRDFLQAQSMQSEVTVRISFRWLDGLTSDMRLVGKSGSHRNKVFNPAGFLEDPDSAQLYVTAPCSEGINTGDL